MLVSIRNTLKYCIVGGLLSLVGCYHDDAPIGAQADAYDQPWLTAGSKQIRADTRVGEAKRTRDESGILFVSVPIRNVTDKQIYVEYHIDFINRNGMQVSTYPGTLTIPSHGTRDAIANSTSNAAESFRMEIRYPRIN